MHLKLRVIPAALAAVTLAACSGGSGTSQSGASATTGRVVDGYLNFAKVVCDSNENGVYDTGEPVTYTSNNGDGKFTFNPGCAHGLLGAVDGTGTNADTQLLFVGQMRAPAGSAIVSPLTTLLAAGMTVAELATALELPTGTNLLQTDPAATNADGSLVNSSLLKKTLAVQQILQKATELANGLAGMSGSVSTAVVYTQVANAMAATLKGGPPLISGGATPIASESVVGAVLAAAINSIFASATVDAAVKAALVKAGGNATLPVVVKPALTAEAQAILSALDANLTATVMDRQSNTVITDMLTAAVNAGTLSATTSAAALSSLASDVAIAAAKATVLTDHVPVPVSGSTTLFTFDESPAGFTAMGGYGGALPTVETPALSDAGMALKISKPTGIETWGGIYFVSANAIPFAINQKQITAAVYSSKANAVIKFKGEASDGTSVEVVGTTTGAANTWSTVTWDLAGVDSSKVYKTIAITPDADVVTSGQSYYFDNIALAPAGTTPVVVPKSGVLATFDEAIPLVFAGFGGAEGSSITSGPVGGAANALNVLRTGGQTYAGAVVTVGLMDVSSTNTTITARVYSPIAGVPIVLKLEAPDANVNTGEIAATEAVVVGWQTLSWVVPIAKISSVYTKVVLLPNLGTLASVSPGESFYFDDITLGAAIVPTPTNYLYIPNNAIGLTADGTDANTVNYSMSAFQTTGINVKWPMANGAAIKLQLAENGTFNIAAGQTLSAAVQIEDTATGGSGQIRAYTDGVSVSKTGTSITLTVPNLPQALIYGVSGDGKTKAVIDYASKVKGISNVLSTAASTLSTVVFGDVVNFGINGMSNNFTNMSALRGTYKVTIVVNQLPLKKADGTAFDTATIQMPTTVVNGVEGGIIPITGSSLVGYINLTN